jgi:hypothetical protein
MGVVLWYQIQFPDQKINISSDVNSGDYLVDAQITITYAIGQPGEFDVRLDNLPLNVSQSLQSAVASAISAAAATDSGVGTDAGGVKIVISLGYLDDPDSKAAVLTGLVESIEPTATFPPLGLRLGGHETASFLLLNTVNIYHEKPTKHVAHISEPGQPSGSAVSPADLAKLIVTQSGAKIAAAAAAPLALSQDPITSPLRDPNTGEAVKVTADAGNAFELLRNVASRFSAEILVQEGVVMFGQAVQYPAPSGTGVPLINPAAVLAMITGDNSLIAVTRSGLTGARLAEFKPAQIASTSRSRGGGAPAADAKGFDFTVLGEPSIRAGQMVVASIDGYQDPTNPFRILTVTHAFSPKSGYTCAGRAVTFQTQRNRKISELAQPGSAPAVADRISGKIRDAHASSPSVDVGKVDTAKAADRTATLFYRQQPDGETVSVPCVDLDVPESKSVLVSKPIAAPFAWHNVGLSVPVYPGMRALLNQVRGSRDDTVVTGFLWANEPTMSPPPAHDGDWWLCLPTALSGSPPLPSGPGANDLITGDGLRVIEAAGLSITVGKDKCTAVGTRPAEGPADVFLITHKSGTTIQVDAQGNVTVDGSGSQVVLQCGGASLTVGNGKVAIS